MNNVVDLKEWERNKKKETEVKELVVKLSNFVNSFSIEFNQFNQEMSREHRTLQQSFTKLCMKWLEHVASDDYLTDGRNEESKQLAKEIQSKLEFPLGTYLRNI